MEPAPRGPNQWHAFDPEKILLDPYAKSTFLPPWVQPRTGKKSQVAMEGKHPLGRSGRRGPARNIQSSVPPPRHYSDAIIYEMHVRGFTASSSSDVTAETPWYFCRNY